MTKCLFCRNPATSKEHMWPQWVLERVNTREPIRRQIGQLAPKWTDNPEVKIKSVCHDCNNGWMSGLEQKSIPLVGALLGDIQLNLDASQQAQISLWAAKTAMILDSVRGHVRFYSPSECEELKIGKIPASTAVWLGRYLGSSLHGDGATFSILSDGRKIGEGCVNTILIGHLILQVLTTHVSRDDHTHMLTIHRDILQKWSGLLIQVRPIAAKAAQWPPRDSFSNYGRFPFGSLVNRFRVAVLSVL